MSLSVQQINLFLPELRPNRDWLRADMLLVTVAAVVVMLGLSAAWSAWQRSSAAGELEELQALLQAQTELAEQIEREAAGRATDQSLVAEMNTREQRLEQTRDLYEFMRSTELGNLAGYSEHLKDLSRASFQGLWLTEIRIDGDAERVYLSGNAEQPAMLPDFVGRLGMGRSRISSKRFNRLQTTRMDGANESYSFILEAGP